MNFQPLVEALSDIPRPSESGGDWEMGVCEGRCGLQEREWGGDFVLRRKVQGFPWWPGG